MVKTNQSIVDFKVLLNSYSLLCRVICSGQMHKWYLVSCMVVDNVLIIYCIIYMDLSLSLSLSLCLSLYIYIYIYVYVYNIPSKITLYD